MTSPRRARLLLALLASLCPLVAGAQALPPDIAKSKVLRVALDPTYPPLEYKDTATGQLAGFDIDMANAMGADLGIKIEWQVGTFEQLTPSLQSGRADAVISGFYDIPKRRPAFDFVDYLRVGAQFYTLTKNADIKTPLDVCGKTVSTTRGTNFPDVIKAWSAANCEKAGKGAITVITDTDQGQELANLVQGRAEVAVQGLEAIPAIMDRAPGTYRIIGEPISKALMGMATLPANSALRDVLQAELKKMIADGRYAALVTKWKLTLSSYTDATVNAGPTP